MQTLNPVTFPYPQISDVISSTSLLLPISGLDIWTCPFSRLANTIRIFWGPKPLPSSKSSHLEQWWGSHYQSHTPYLLFLGGTKMLPLHLKHDKLCHFQLPLKNFEHFSLLFFLSKPPLVLIGQLLKLHLRLISYVQLINLNCSIKMGWDCLATFEWLFYVSFPWLKKKL